MAAARTRARLARTTVALGAAGTVALAPLAPLAVAQETAAAVLEPVAIRVGSAEGFTRVELAGVVGSRARVRQDGRSLIVRIGTTAAPDVSRLKVDPPPGVATVETRAVPGGTELVLALAEGGEARWGQADGAVWLNLYPTPGETTAAAGKIAPGTVVPVAVSQEAGRTTLDFRWPAAVGAAVFRRGPAVWIVFDATARLDLHAEEPSQAQWAAGPDYTVVRVPVSGDTGVSARPDGTGWTVTLGSGGAAAQGVEMTRDDSGEQALVLRMAGATRTVWLTDPMVGDRFAAVTALAPGKGFGARRSTMELSVLPTAQGLAIETSTDDLSIVADGDLVTVSRPGGLSLSPPSAALQAAAQTSGTPEAARHPAMILEIWGQTGDQAFFERHRALQDAAALEAVAAADQPRAPAEARLALARFLVGSQLGYEAIGVLDALVRQSPALQGEPEVRGLRGIARASIGRYEEAATDFSVGALVGDPSVKLWQGYLAAQNADWDGARRDFAAGAAVVDQFPAAWRARFATSHALAALESGDLAGAGQLLNYVFAQNAPASDQLAARLVQARLFELEGQSDRAHGIYAAVARAPSEGISTPARLGQIRLDLARGTIKPDAATAELEQLKWRWRGDATELAVIRTLGEIYLGQGRYREALEALRGAGARLGSMKGGAELQAQLADAFRAMFLDGAADGLQPIQALGLFYDFRELTPVGADGDEMVRRLARRLVDVDLLAPAAELLTHQVDNRLDGVAKAQVATDLATIHLMDRQPEKALQAIWGSRTTLLPAALNAERRALEARALMDLGRLDHALETLANDQSPAARDVRADIAWKQQDWGAAARLYEARLGERAVDTSRPLTADEENRLVRAGVGYSLAGDAGALSRLGRNYRPFVDRARNPAALRIALAGTDDLQADAATGDFAALTAGADTFAGWVTAMKASLREKTARTKTGGAGTTAPTPARPGNPPASGAAAA